MLPRALCAVLTVLNESSWCRSANFQRYRRDAGTDRAILKFEGKVRDTETGNEHFGARYYSNRFGCWLSADWSAVPAPVPYANFTNPQTLNLYAMVADDHATCYGSAA